MKSWSKVIFLLFISVSVSCSSKNETKKNQIVLESDQEQMDEKQMEYASLPIKPNKVLITAHPQHKLVTVYKEKITKDGKHTFIDGNYRHYSYNYDDDPCNEWNGHFMPGLEAVYGYKMYNISHFDTASKSKNDLFDKAVLVKTLYFPAFEQDTLNCIPVKRDYYLVSVYDEDTNEDGVISSKDLRRLYSFDLNGINKQLLIPKEYSVTGSEYDVQNDDMYVFATLDENGNGLTERGELVHIFLLDLQKPQMAQRLF